MVDYASVEAVLSHVDKTLDKAQERLFTLLRIPSISTQSQHAADCRRAAEWLRDDLKSCAMIAEVRDVRWAKPGNPMVVAHSTNHRDGKPHVLFYGHYDVQPTDPEHEWKTAPFDPQMAEDASGRKVIIARGASDDKGQVMTFLEACRAWKEVHGELPVKVSVLLEGEEESGGENLLPFLKENAEELKADVALICDTTMADRRTPAITTSLRGTVAEEVILSAATHDLHSGMYGNAAANPIALLCQALATLRDRDGRVTLPGFYEGVTVPDDATRAQWRRLFPSDEIFLEGTGLSIAAGEKGFSAVEQTWCRPSCEINGISGGYEDEGFKTVLPATARAKVSFRLVPGQNPDRIQEAFRQHIRQALPKDVKAEFISHGRSEGFAVAKSSQFLPATLKALSEEWSNEAVTVGSGGSIPVAGEVREALSMDALMVGFAQADDRIHSPNERYGLDSFHKGIRSWVRILAALSEK
ncbi:M20/M25/M40 family metallo-hydrolase [Saccharibacter sp. 17.LH.SD]|uniref:M20/M25/M40 family metallo-hydrolase n=1 Tax=Saccharibacter sp. 17.LH.SD TaxID=2689393 RepID=UPI0013709C74|nr:M20/M25/M40 family metallo-hydrolase [Saccharibacter sp. 17.LH.SD]MXV43542.1 M20/M25/M40 family metallo-hydrolase [Saccharibacter sp. 17.LH.SD]